MQERGVQREGPDFFPLPPPRVKTNKLWEEWEKDQLLLACRKYGTKVYAQIGSSETRPWYCISAPPPPHKGVMYVMDLKIEGLVFLPDTPGKIQSSSGRMQEKDKILLACRK